MNTRSTVVFYSIVPFPFVTENKSGVPRVTTTSVLHHQPDGSYGERLRSLGTHLSARPHRRGTNNAPMLCMQLTWQFFSCPPSLRMLSLTAETKLM